MQLIPATAGDMARLTGIKLHSNEQLFDPEININFGTLYLRQLEKLFKGQKEYMLAAYNAGPHRVKRWKKLPGSSESDVFIENIEFTETRNYVKKVMKNYWAYKLLGANFQTDHPQLLLGLN
jgi:soluble lytic murein transglycosylase